MSRTVTVKGIGKASQKPDLIVLSFTVEAKDIDYQKTMEIGASRLDEMRKSIMTAGFDKCDLKTGSFHVNSVYENIRDKDGNYKNVFKGYSCIHELSLEFAFDMKKLSAVLDQVSGSSAKPRFSISFTVKDHETFKSKVIENAVENAKVKAAALAKASGVQLGQIIDINYSWADVNIHSVTRFERATLMSDAKAASIDIEPKDVDISDNVTIVWEIL